METRQGISWVAGKDTPDKTWITRILNFGTWEEWQILKQKMSPAKIKEALEHPLKGQWTRHGKAFAEVMFDYQLPDEVLTTYHV